MNDASICRERAHPFENGRGNDRVRRLIVNWVCLLSNSSVIQDNLLFRNKTNNWLVMQFARLMFIIILCLMSRKSASVSKKADISHR